MYACMQDIFNLFTLVVNQLIKATSSCDTFGLFVGLCMGYLCRKCFVVLLDIDDFTYIAHSQKRQPERF